MGLLALAVGRNAVAQDVLGGASPFNGAYFGTVGAGGYGAGPFGTGAFGTGSVASLTSSKVNATLLALSAGVGETDNVLLSSGSKQSETLAIAGLNVGLSRHEPRLDAAAIGNFEDLYYLQHAFGNQLFGSFNGDASLGLVPSRLNWVIDESYGQSLLNPLQPAVPSNLQNVNVVSTGPDLLLHPFSAANLLQIGARYGRSDYGNLPYGAHEAIGLFALGRELSQTSSLALHITDQKLYFDNTVVNQNYTLRKAYGGYRVQGARTSIEVDAGAAQVNDGPNRTTRWTTRPIAQVTLTRQLSPTMTLSLQGGRQVTEIADSFAALQASAGGAIVVAPVSGTTGSYVNTLGSAAWTFALHRTTVSASASWERAQYDFTPLLDTKIENYAIRFSRRLTPRLAVFVTGTLARTDYYQGDFSNDTRTVDAALQWQLAPKLQVTLQYAYDAQGNSGLVQTLSRSGYFDLLTTSRVSVADSYTANSVFLMFTYVPISQ